MRKLTPILFFIAAVECLAQAPVINNVQPISAGPAQKIVISGSGFSPTIASNTVWFDHVKGTVTAATAYSLEVQVPNQARYSNVEVLVGGLSAKSPMKFSPSYGGVSLDASKFTAATPATAPYIDTNEQFDVASADLDMDGDPDFVTTRGGPTSGAVITDLSLYQNNSTGIGNITLAKITQPLTLGAPTANVICGDLNGDGKPDILASRGSNGIVRNEVFVLKNANTTPGTMAFTNQAKIVLDPGEFAFRIAIRDLNGDGKPDVVISNARNDSQQSPPTDNIIYVYPNQSTLSTISFGSPLKLTVTGTVDTYGLEVQDFDGDGRADIAVNGFQKPDVYFFRNTSTGNISFTPVQKIPTSPGSFIQMVAADINNDGKPDLIGTDTGGGSDYIQFWINASSPGNIQFTIGQTMNTDPTPWGIDVGDIDGDGDVDIAVACFGGNNINVFRQDGALSFTRVNIPIPGYSARNLRIGDYDGDGKPDIAYTGKPTTGFANTLAILRNGNCWNPTITGSSTTICTGQTIPLQTKPAFGVNFDWKLNGASQTLGSPPYNFSATAAGTYAVTLTGTIDTGCSNTSSNYVLTQDVATFPSDPTITNNVPCFGNALNLNTTATADTYAWTGPNGFTSSAQNPTINPISFNSAGTYTLQLKMNNGCTSNIVSKILDVASVPKLPITASPSLIGCAGGSVTLSVPTNGTYTYQWNKGGSAIGGQTTPSLSLPSLSASDEANYTVSVTSTVNTCTQVTDAAALQVYSLPSAAFTKSGTPCVGSVITFTDASTKDSRGTLTYAWAFGDTGPTSTSNLQSPTHVYTTASTFSVSLSVSYQGACTNASTPMSVVINAATIPTISTTAAAICSGDQTTLSIAGSYTTITWTGTTGGQTAVITQPGKYKVNTIDANGCALADSIVINAKPLITPFVAASKRAVITLGDTTQLTATAGADSYLWKPGKMLSTDSTIANPIAKPQATTAYIVVAKKAGSCDASDTVTVRVDVGSALIKPPVLFSPNADTFNDTWLIPETSNYPDWTMTIFDGHGSQVYQQKGYNNTNAWDGTFSGKPSPDGTYFYVFSNQKDKPATGSVLLVR